MVEIDKNYRPEKHLWLTGRNITDLDFTDSVRQCPNCKSKSFKLVDGIEFNRTFLHVTNNGKADKRHKNNPEIAQYISYNQCNECACTFRVIHMINDVVGADNAWLSVEQLDTPAIDSLVQTNRKGFDKDQTAGRKSMIFMMLAVLITVVILTAYIM